MAITYDANYWDHRRDHQKHDDTPPLYAQSARVNGALEVAILAKAVPLQAAADLIEQYARTCASAAKLDAVAETIERCCEAIEAHGSKPAPMTAELAAELSRRAT